MSGRLLLLVLSVLLLNPSTAETQAVGPETAVSASYKIWIGKFPSDRVNGKTFLEQPDVQRRIKRVLGANALRDMRQMHVSDRAQGYKNWLLVGGCQPHFCTYAQWTVAINMISGDTWACVAALNSQLLEYGSSKSKSIRVPRKMEEEGCPEGARISERFDRLFPTELR